MLGHFRVHVRLLNCIGCAWGNPGNVSAMPDLPLSSDVSDQAVLRPVTKTLTATGFNESARRVEPEKIA
jgi:hypothetical protein